MKKNIIILLALLCFSFYGMSEEVDVTNSSGNPIYISVVFNDGFDCDPDEIVTGCVASGSSITISSAFGYRPFSLTVLDLGVGCSPSGPVSWAHNPTLSCTAPPTSMIDPYTVTWGALVGITWSVTVT